LELDRIGGDIGRKFGGGGCTTISKSSRTWLAILAIGLISGAVGVAEDGWNVGDSIG
jgi:hypothetical protein